MTCTTEKMLATSTTSMLTNENDTAQEEVREPYVFEAESDPQEFWLDEVASTSRRTYAENLPPLAERIECARTYLAAIDLDKDKWKCEPQDKAAHYVVIGFAVEPQYAWNLLLEFNRRCNPPLSEADLRKVIADVDKDVMVRGWHLLVQVKLRADDPHELANLFLSDDWTEENESRWRYWREEWLRWDGCRYVVTAEKEVRGRVTAAIRKAMVAYQQQECRRLRSEYERQIAARVPLSGTTPPRPPVMPSVISVTSHLVNNTMQALASLTLLPFAAEHGSWLGKDGQVESRNCMAFQNGLIQMNLDGGITADLEPHSPRWFSTVCLPYDWDPDASCPRWLKALDLTFGGDAERTALLQEWFGYCLMPGTDLQKFLMLVGEGNNGKSVICAALTAVLGQDNVSNVPLEAFAERFALTSTIGKLANIAAEVGELDKTAEGKLKSFTSGDRMTFDRKNKSPVETVPTARLVLATNNLPRFSDRTNGIWRRLLLIPCDVTIPDDRRVAGMDKPKWWEDSGELPGILQWALEGLRRLRKNGRFTQPKACEEAVRQHRTDSNPARAFLIETCQAAEGHKLACETVYAVYTTWCDKNGYRQPLASSQFGKEIRRAFPSVVHKQGGSKGCRQWVYEGLAFHSPALVNVGARQVNSFREAC